MYIYIYINVFVCIYRVYYILNKIYYILYIIYIIYIMYYIILDVNITLYCIHEIKCIYIYITWRKEIHVIQVLASPWVKIDQCYSKMLCFMT